MNCEKFRLLINNDEAQLTSETEESLEKHLDECQSCNQWLESSIAKAPIGLDTLELVPAPASTFPKDVKPVITKEAKPEKNKSVFGSFINGLKYGLVFGLSVVFGLAIINIINDNKPNPLFNDEVIPSFVQLESIESGGGKTSGEEIPSFIEMDFYANTNFMDLDEGSSTSFDSFLAMDNFYKIDFEEET